MGHAVKIEVRGSVGKFSLRGAMGNPPRPTPDIKTVSSHVPKTGRKNRRNIVIG
jgi:hypothetical protein